MNRWEYCEVNFDGTVSYAWLYDKDGQYLVNPLKHARVGVLLAQLGHDGWEIVSTWWWNDKKVSYILKRPIIQESSVAGLWIGKTEGSEVSEHYWEIFENGSSLVIKTWWIDSPENVKFFPGSMLPDMKGFVVHTTDGEFQALFDDDMHLIISAWHCGKEVVFTRQISL